MTLPSLGIVASTLRGVFPEGPWRSIEAAREALEHYGPSCTGSRFLNGNLIMHEQLERELAELDDTRTQGAAEVEELTQAIHRLRGSIGSLNREGRVRLLAAFEKVDAVLTPTTPTPVVGQSFLGSARAVGGDPE